MAPRSCPHPKTILVTYKSDAHPSHADQMWTKRQGN